MIKESQNIPWEYIKLSQVMASVRSDLQVFDDANMIDEDKCIKIVMQCNEKLGQRIYKSKSCKIDVNNYRGERPSDLWKIENIFALSTNHHTGFLYSEGGGVIGATQITYTDYVPPKILSKDVSTLTTKCATQLSCCAEAPCSTGCGGRCTGKLTYLTQEEKQYIEYNGGNKLIPLTLATSVLNDCVNYSPCSRYKGEYSVNMDDDEFEFTFEKGTVYISYLGNMVDEDGEVLIPFHPMLNQYYEFALKEKILQDIYLNTQADVIQRLQYVSAEKSKHYYDAYQYIQTAKAGQYDKMRKQREMNYYNKWYSMF